MKKLTLLAFALTTCGGIAQATPIATMGTYTASSIAIVEPSLIDTQFGTSSPDALALAVSAYSTDGTNSAFAVGLADTYFLSTSTEISSSDSAVTAAGSSEYMGTFLAPDGSFRLTVNFSNNAQVSGAATSETVFGLDLMAGLTTIWSFEYHYPLFNDAGLIDQTFAQVFTLPVGTLADLSVRLLSTSDAALPGDAFNLASAQFGISSVPEPSTLFALSAGLALLPFARKRSTKPTLTLA